MMLGRVVGTVWATRRDPTLEGLKLMMVRGLRPDSTLTDVCVIAVDAVGAGTGETVLVAQGSSGRQTEVTKDRPVDAVIMAIVDGVHLADSGKAGAQKAQA
jgi:microcompartment protein CcmK/EutM